MVTQALAGYHDGPACHFVGNICPTDLHDVLVQCDPHTTLFIITSKSFTTAETLANAMVARQWLVQHGADVGMPPARMAAEVARALWLAQEHGLDWSEQQCRLLLEAVREYQGGAFDIPQDVAWAEVIDYVPGKDAMGRGTYMKIKSLGDAKL